LFFYSFINLLISLRKSPGAFIDLICPSDEDIPSTGTWLSHSKGLRAKPIYLTYIDPEKCVCYT
jgi:hypothetical protein